MLLSHFTLRGAWHAGDCLVFTIEILKIKAKPMKLHEEVDLEQVAADTHGYCGADLGQLVTEAAMQTVRERAGDIDVDADEVPPELLASMVVKNEHFKFAMTKCQPSSLRDKAVEIPDCSWDDVGGLLDVKREMTETLARYATPSSPSRLSASSAPRRAGAKIAEWSLMSCATPSAAFAAGWP